MTPAQAVHAMQQYETCSWVAVLRSDQTSKALTDVRPSWKIRAEICQRCENYDEEKVVGIR
jgi:hypothetical protein